MEQGFAYSNLKSVDNNQHESQNTLENKIDVLFSALMIKKMIVLCIFSFSFIMVVEV